MTSAATPATVDDVNQRAQAGDAARRRPQPDPRLTLCPGPAEAVADGHPPPAGSAAAGCVGGALTTEFDTRSPAGKFKAIRQALAALEASRNHYAELHEFAPSASLALTEQGLIAELNRAGASLLRLDRQAALNRPFADFVATEQVGLWHRKLSRLAEPQSRVSFEIALVRGDGTCSRAQFDGLRLETPGMPPLVLAILTDIALHNETEPPRLEAEEFFDLIAESPGTFSAVLDLQDRRLHTNSAYHGLFGDMTNLLAADSPAEAPGDDPSGIIEALRQTSKTGTSRRRPYRLVQADGSFREMEAVIGAIRDDKGQVARLVVVAQDVTERNQAEQQLRMAATAFEAHIGMMITDANGVIRRVNRAFSELTGYSAEEAVGRTPKLLASGRQDAAFYAAMWREIHRAGSWQGEIWNRHKDGRVFPQWLTISAVPDGDGASRVHYVATMTDLSESKAAQDQIRHLAFYDDLTQLPNRRFLLDRLQWALATCERSGRPGALLLIDLDNFKELNDAWGHANGDLLLQLVAQRLNGCIREVDMAARLGGD